MTAPAKVYVGCGCVVDDGSGRYLLVRETKAIARGRLSLPAGGLEADESLAHAAIREVVEETGLTVEVTGLLGIFHCERTSEGSYGVNMVFGAQPISGSLTPTSEHPELLWLTADEITQRDQNGEIRGAHVVAAVRRAQAGQYLADDLISVVGSNDGSAAV